MTATSNPFRVEVVSGVPAWMSGHDPLTWGSIPNTRMDSVGSPAGILSFSGAAYDGATMYMFGGGHNDYSGNEVNKLPLGDDAPAWSQPGAPSPSQPLGVIYYPDGKPSSRHSYWAIQFSEAHNRMFLLGGLGAFTDTYQVSYYMDAFDVTANAWDAGAGAVWPGLMPYSVSHSTIEQDSAGRIWMAANSRLYRCDPTTMAWTNLGPVSRATQVATPMCHDTARNRLILPVSAYGNPGQLFLLSGYSSGMPPSVSVYFTGPHADKPGRYQSWTYCGDRDSYLFMRDGDATQTVYEVSDLDNPTNTFHVDVLLVAGQKPTLSGLSLAGHFGRFKWIPELRACVLTHRVDNDVMFFRTA